jgi:hypothetical protein
MKDYDEIRLRRYLLDQMSQDEKDQVEHDLLVDEDLFEAAEAVEDDLLDAYAPGQLTPEERESIVRRLAASPRGQARLDIVKGLATLPPTGQVIPFRPPVTRSRPFARFAIAAGLAGASGTAILLWRWRQDDSAARAEIGLGWQGIF